MMDTTEDTRAVVESFLATVRSGRAPELAGEYLAGRVRAHQVESENPVTIERTPDEYAAHVREMLDTWGPFELSIDEFLVEGARAYVRFTQIGRHVGPVAGFDPTGGEVRQVNSVIYRVDSGRICEYWMQIDRAGLLSQLRSHASHDGRAVTD